MSVTRSEQEIKAFYDRWKGPVLTFCRLFLGEESGAEETAAEAFLGYVRQGCALDTGKLPVLLLKCVVVAAKARCTLARASAVNGPYLRRAILALPCEQRAIFILRDVLGQDVAATAIATGLPHPQVRKLWCSALLRVRELLPREFFKERVQ